MAGFVPTVVTFGALVVSAALWKKWREAARAEHIRRYVLPKGLFDKLRKKHPQLTLKDCQLVGQALRQYFLAYLKGGRKYVSMPSRVTDDLWHELILYTRTYQGFCGKAFGKFLHHTPAVALGSKKLENEGLRRVWRLACREENIDPRKPTRLPLLFAIDAKLGIEGGFRYVADAAALPHGKERESDAGEVFYTSDFSSADFDGGTDGFSDSSFSSDGGDGGGGDGCGGGCGGD